MAALPQALPLFVFKIQRPQSDGFGTIGCGSCTCTVYHVTCVEGKKVKIDTHLETLESASCSTSAHPMFAIKSTFHFVAFAKTVSWNCVYTTFCRASNERVCFPLLCCRIEVRQTWPGLAICIRTKKAVFAAIFSSSVVVQVKTNRTFRIM